MGPVRIVSKYNRFQKYKKKSKLEKQAILSVNFRKWFHWFEIKMAGGLGRYPVGCTGEGKRWKGNTRKGWRESETGTFLYEVEFGG